MRGFGIRILRRLECTRVLFQSFKDDSCNKEGISCHQNPLSGRTCDEPEVKRVSLESEPEQISPTIAKTGTDCCSKPSLLRNRDVINDGFCTFSTDDDDVFEDCLDSTEQYWQEEEDGEAHDDQSSEGSTDLAEFSHICPPGGSNSVILYTTSLRGIRKTFEDCRRVKFLLDSLEILYYERDVSLHLEFREELRGMMKLLSEGGTALFSAVPPRLFVRGRHVGGADEVVELHEQGKLKDLLRGIPLHRRGQCDGCADVGFVLCGDCNGSRKLRIDVDGEEAAGGGNAPGELLMFSLCRRCNENGLIKCPVCCVD